jgi:hypothetical protein
LRVEAQLGIGFAALNVAACESEKRHGDDETRKNMFHEVHNDQ